MNRFISMKFLLRGVVTAIPETRTNNFTSGKFKTIHIIFINVLKTVLKVCLQTFSLNVEIYLEQVLPTIVSNSVY